MTMCNFDGGVDVDLDTDIDIGENIENDFDVVDDLGNFGSEIKNMSDIGGVSDDLREEETLQDIEEVVDHSDVEEIESYPELSEIEDIYVQSDVDDGIEDISLSEFDDVEPELTFSQEELQELYDEHVDDSEFSDRIGELISSGRIAISEMEDIDEPREDGVKVHTREITPEILESREHDTEEVLENYTENLQERGIPEEQIEEFVEHERENINAEYESLDAGKPSENIYQMPTNWDEVAEDVENADDDISIVYEEDSESTCLEIEENTEEIIDSEDVIEEYNHDYWGEQIGGDNPILPELAEESEAYLGDISEALEDSNLADEDLELRGTSEYTEQLDNVSDDMLEENNENFEEIQETEINYDEIYEQISQECLEEGFEDIDVYEDSERLDTILEEFEENNWENLTLEEQKHSMNNLAEYVEEIIGFDKPPRIEYYNNPREGDYGGYNSQTNTLSVNEYMLYNNDEAADTIAHELWHAHQQECAEHPMSSRDYQYRYNFENYIRPEMGHEAYENQLVEAEARAFARQFKGRIHDIEGRKI